MAKNIHTHSMYLYIILNNVATQYVMKFLFYIYPSWLVADVSNSSLLFLVEEIKAFLMCKVLPMCSVLCTFYFLNYRLIVNIVYPVLKTCSLLTCIKDLLTCNRRPACTV